MIPEEVTGRRHEQHNHASSSRGSNEAFAATKSARCRSERLHTHKDARATGDDRIDEKILWTLCDLTTIQRQNGFCHPSSSCRSTSLFVSSPAHNHFPLPPSVPFASSPLSPAFPVNFSNTFVPVPFSLRPATSSEELRVGLLALSISSAFSILESSPVDAARSAAAGASLAPEEGSEMSVLSQDVNKGEDVSWSRGRHEVGERAVLRFRSYRLMKKRFPLLWRCLLGLCPPC